MQIRPVNVCGTLVVSSKDGGYVFADDNWPDSVAVEHVLQALCGASDSDGFYVVHEGNEDQSRQWIAMCLSVVSKMGTERLGMMAIQDHARLAEDGCETLESQSMVAAASVAVVLLERALRATREEARFIVQINLAADRCRA